MPLLLVYIAAKLLLWLLSEHLRKLEELNAMRSVQLSAWNMECGNTASILYI